MSGQALPAPSASSPGREPSRAPGAASQLAPLPLPPPCLQGKGTPWHCTGCASLLEQCRDRFPPKVALPWRQENGQTPAAPASGRWQGVPACQPLPCFPEIPLIVLEVMDPHFQEHVYKDMNEEKLPRIVCASLPDLFAMYFLVGKHEPNWQSSYNVGKASSCI